MKTINGQIVPENLSLSEIKKMMETNDMQTFVIACHALRFSRTHEAYMLLKKYITTKDKYKLRCILEVIFDYEESVELVSYLVEALQSKERYLITTALAKIRSGKAVVDDEYIFSCLEKNYKWLDSYDYCILKAVEKSDINTERIINLFNKSDANSVKISEVV